MLVNNVNRVRDNDLANVGNGRWLLLLRSNVV